MRPNYKEFKKIHEDANTATLRHPEGHEVKVAKGALSDHMKKQISSLKFCDGGEVQHMSDGGELAATKDENGHWIPNEQPRNTHRIDSLTGAVEDYKAERKPDTTGVVSSPQKSDNTRAVPDAARKALGFADGGPVEEPHGGMSMPDGTELQPTAEQAAPDMVSQMANMDIPASAPTGPQNPVLPQAAPAPTVPQQANYVEQGMSQQLSGIQGQAKAEGKLGNAEAAAAEQNTHRLNELDVMHQHNQRKIQTELDSVIHDYNQGKIDPNQYWNNRGTLGKMGTAIGLILGGMSAGVTGGPNPALQFVNAQIDRDIEGQKAEAGRKMNVITALQHQLGNNIDATNMAKAMQAGVFASKLMEEAAKSKDPLALERAKQASGQILATYGPMVQQTALRQTMLQGIQSGHAQPAQAVPFLVPKEEQKDAFKEIATASEVSGMRTNMLKSFDHIAGKVLNGTFSPNDTESAKQAFIGKLIKVTEGRYNYEAAENLAKALLPGKTDTPDTVKNKRERLNDLHDSLSQTPVLDAYGIKIPKAPQFHK